MIPEPDRPSPPADPGGLARALIETGQAEMARGDATAAARAFGRAVKLNPVDPEAFYQLGMALAQSGDLAGASTHLWAAHALRADFFEAINEFGLVELQLGRFDTAMDAFLRAAELAPSKANYLNGGGGQGRLHLRAPGLQPRPHPSARQRHAPRPGQR